MLRGAHGINLDSKGRFAIPTKYRDWLLDECQGQLVCTVDINSPCLLLYPLHEWLEVEKKLQGLSSMRPQERRLQRLLLGYATDCELDKAGRILLGSPLRQYASLDKKLMLVGQLNKFELWDEASWLAQVEQDVIAQRGSNEELSQGLQEFSL
ncbi:division/cell wall cluster transcriptional repressor MraZ [Motilimonas pumila]|uniref:Transcriptional regulator MraZ n=1 Tax=Motilimonas pumila TaxID=2303987 RepID=A0A418YI59_9GAMM|nr:division/cell wall cluster transcriptional repressor MraZ [Motilimonas pumila]RJG50027.1 transcriptional regulator MraZ [Motilimonas pumila]